MLVRYVCGFVMLACLAIGCSETPKANTGGGSDKSASSDANEKKPADESTKDEGPATGPKLIAPSVNSDESSDKSEKKDK